MSTVSNVSKKGKGQFFTPIEIAQFMSDQISVEKKDISILDPGCGTCVLSCALIERLIKQHIVHRIRLIGYETDSNVIPYTNRVLAYLAGILKTQGIDFEYILYEDDFILKNYKALNFSLPNINDDLEKFDIIISNPPYFKLSSEDKRVRVTRQVIDGQPNIYSLFIAISVGLLNEDGNLIFIVPRSFTSGRYFRLFREYFLAKIEISFIHLFNTRKSTFARDNVLQETIIIKGFRRRQITFDSEICISYSEGINDLNSTKQKVYSYPDIVNIESVDKIIHIPINSREETIIKLFKSWSGSLQKYNIQISTGPVVAFRLEGSLCETAKDANVAPLYWLHNVIKMLVDHPVYNKGKKQYITISALTPRALIPNRNYVFLRRFSSKDDKSRLIAAPYLCNSTKSKYIGVENKLNYIYRPKGHLNRAEVIGISALLNSDLFDTYFRTFNGNVNVSATELRGMPLPDLEIIKSIGERMILKNNFSIENVNEVVNSYFFVD
nr:MAG TPA: type II restriction enzyme [Caudoviricetes sp.]